MKKRWKVTLGITGGLCVTAAVIFYYVGDYFYDYALNPNSDKNLEQIIESRYGTAELTNDEQKAKKTRKKANQWLKKNAAADYLESRDGLQLHSYRITNEKEGHNYVIICHGYRNQGSYMGIYAQAFYQMGFHLVIPDARGHGKSEGSYIGMGWPERLDVVDWCRRITAADPAAQIVLFGVSMGAATVMMASGEDLPAQVRLIIEDCGYTSVWDEFRLQMDELFEVATIPALTAADLVTRVRAGYGFKEASAIRQVEKNTLPILFIHGEDDAFVPFAMADQLYEAAREPKAKLAIPGAGHGGSAQTDSLKYWNTIEEFINSHMNL